MCAPTVAVGEPDKARTTGSSLPSTEPCFARRWARCWTSRGFRLPCAVIRVSGEADGRDMSTLVARILLSLMVVPLGGLAYVVSFVVVSAVNRRGDETSF